MKSLKSRKAELTREINSQAEYLAELKEMSESQGERFFYDFDNGSEVVKCKRWIRLGDWFFPRDIKKAERELEALKAKRQALDLEVEVKEEVVEESELSVKEVVENSNPGKVKLKVAMTYKVHQIESLMARLGSDDFSVDFRYNLTTLGMTVEQFDEVLLSLEQFFTMDRHRVILERGIVNFLID